MSHKRPSARSSHQAHASHPHSQQQGQSQMDEDGEGEADGAEGEQGGSEGEDEFVYDMYVAVDAEWLGTDADADGTGMVNVPVVEVRKNFAVMLIFCSFLLLSYVYCVRGGGCGCKV